MTIGKSGNFLLEENVNMEKFDGFIRQYILDEGCVVSDSIYIPRSFSSGAKSGLLLALSHESNVASSLSNGLVNAGDVLKKLEDTHSNSTGLNSFYLREDDHYVDSEGEVIERFGFGDDKRKRFPVYVGKFETIGLYHQEKTAMDLFSSVAQGLYIGYVENKVDEVEGKIKHFLDSKLRSL